MHVNYSNITLLQVICTSHIVATPEPVYRVAQKNLYTLAAVRRLQQCLYADSGHFEHLHWIQNSRTSLISILLLYKYSSYDYRVIFFMSKCVYISLGHSVFKLYFWSSDNTNSLHKYIYIYVYMYVCMYACIYVCVCVCMYVDVCVYIHTHTHTHIIAFALLQGIRMDVLHCLKCICSMKDVIKQGSPSHTH